MSLETAIQENTNAIRALIAAIQSGASVTSAHVAAVVEQGNAAETDKAVETNKAPKAKTEKPADEPKAEEAKPETLVQMNATEAVKALDGHANRDEETPKYQDASAAVTKLAQAKGRDAAVAVLAKFGAKKLPDIKPEQFAAVIAACHEAEAAVEA